MVDEFWLKRWRKFVLGRAARRYEPPGPITNEHLLESVARTRYLMEEGMTVEERKKRQKELDERATTCLLYTSPSPRDRQKSRMPSSA